MLIDHDLIESARSRMAPAGTTLRELPAGRRGVTWMEYIEVWWADMRRAAYEASAAAPPGPVIPIASARDRYGWWQTDGRDRMRLRFEKVREATNGAGMYYNATLSRWYDGFWDIRAMFYLRPDEWDVLLLMFAANNNIEVVASDRPVTAGTA